MGYPENGNFALAAYTITAIVVLSYWISLVRRLRKLK